NLCVSKVPIFNHLEPKEMQDISKMSRHKLFEKGEIIYYEGDPLDYLYIVHQGRVKIYKLFESGRSEEHTSELQSRFDLVCRLLLPPPISSIFFPYTTLFRSNLCVSKVPIFNHLEPKEMQDISKMSRHKLFEKGEIIYYEGDPLDYLYIVHQGRVKIYKLFESG